MAKRPRRLPSLNALRAFWAAARHRSFAAAADELHVTASAVSLQIRQLEEELDFKLFERTPKGLALTAAGSRVLPDVNACINGRSGATLGRALRAAWRPPEHRTAVAFMATGGAGVSYTR